ncbi:MAG: hypothetical protein PHQ14_11155 [Chromatiales bacterium]|nr:hypothetical protein [Chromatiales bacterium]MDX9765748.1 hypothetical protein [Ectothiorhodospiraceae bacterium]
MGTRGFRRCTPATGLLLAMLVWALPTGSRAVEISDRLSLHGFYTLDASLADGADVHFQTNTSEPVVLEDGELNFDNSVVGVQVDFTLTDSLRLTAQAVSSRQTDPNHSPTLEWAYLTYDLGRDLYLRGGRFKIPLLQGTELRSVGYSRLWARPVVPTSGAGGFNDYDGLEVIKRWRLGDYSLRFQGAYGIADHHRDVIDSDDVKLISTRIERDQSWVNLALLHTRYDVSRADGTSLIGEDVEALMGSVEGELTFGDVVVNLGYSFNDAEIIPDENMAYLSLGYRMNRLTPYLLYQNRSMTFEALERQPLPPGAPPPPPRLTPERDGKLNTRGLAVGLRYDLGASYAIKAQIERQSNHDESYVGQPVIDESATIYTLVFEGVF